MAESTIDEVPHRNAEDNAPVRLLPVDTTGWASMVATIRFGPFPEGSWVTIAVDAAAHINAGTVAAVAIGTNPQIPFGVHDFVMPEGATYVAIFGDGAGNGCVWKS